MNIGAILGIAIAGLIFLIIWIYVTKRIKKEVKIINVTRPEESREDTTRNTENETTRDAGNDEGESIFKGNRKGILSKRSIKKRSRVQNTFFEKLRIPKPSGSYNSKAIEHDDTAIPDIEQID